MDIIKFLKILLNAFSREKLKFLFLTFVIFSIFFFGTKGFNGEAYKGRFTVDIGSYYSLRDSIPTKNLIESTDDLFLFLNSYQFFLQFNDKQYRSCPISKAARVDKNYKVYKKGTHVEIIIRSTSQEKVEKCLLFIKNIIFERHNSIKSNYERLINLQIDAISEESLKIKKLLDNNSEDENIKFTPEIELPNDLSFVDNFILEMEKRKRASNLLSTKYMVDVNELRSLSPWKINLRMFTESFQKTELFDYRVYPIDSRYYSNPFISSIILFILSLSLFLVFIFIRYKKKLNI